MDPITTFESIRDAYLRYLDSPFWLRYQALREERRQMLNQDRKLYREPMIEPLPPYELSDHNVAQACAALGVQPDVAEFLAQGLFPDRQRRLYRHQFEAWQASRQGQAVVVTSGTGSGKTECFLLPVLASVIEEASRWVAPEPLDPNRLWWNFRNQERISQRAHEFGKQRPRAVRALLLYPLNALIEDQLARLRDACSSPAALEWMDRHRSRNRIWYGRYSGVTPVPGDRQYETKRSDLRKKLQVMGRDWRRAERSAQSRANQDILSYFQNPDSPEMWSRWDMHDAPPDILITNYCMLNIMLMRSIENPIFELTERWLASDRERNTFFLVVDELHSYRGTAGTEVGYLLRSLLNRIGLEPDSPQLRIISTSASLPQNDARSQDYLEQFFGRDPRHFVTLSGNRVQFQPPTTSLQSRADLFADLNASLGNGAIPPESLTALAQAAGVTLTETTPQKQLAACLYALGVFQPIVAAADESPFTVAQLAARLFGTHARAVAATQSLVRAVSLARIDDPALAHGVAPLPLRLHYFFHHAGRIWACLNPSCQGRTGTTPQGAEAPPVGKLFTEPRPICDACGSRVLELLYCEPCGEVFLGGYRKDSQLDNSRYLSPDFPFVENLPDRTISFERRHEDYLVFWPAGGRPLAQQNRPARPAWVWQKDGVSHAWVPAVLSRTLAQLSLPQTMPTTDPEQSARGYTFTADSTEANALPTKCPHCASDWAGRNRGPTSPIRQLGTGYQRIAQILCDGLMREMNPGASRKLVLFTDSRQDAAKLSTGVKTDHYRDALRQCTYQASLSQIRDEAQQYQAALASRTLVLRLIELERKHNDQGLAQPERDERRQLRASLPDAIVAAIARHVDDLTAPVPAILTPPQRPSQFSPMPFNRLLNEVRRSLLRAGTNPGGPAPSLKSSGSTYWANVFDWNPQSQSFLGYKTDLNEREGRLRDAIETAYTEDLVENVLFAGGSRDVESLGLAIVWVRNSPPANTIEQAAASAIRILGMRRRWIGSENTGSATPPWSVDRYLQAVATLNHLDHVQLRDQVETALGQSLVDWLVHPSGLLVLGVGPNDYNQISFTACRRCGRYHLHESAGVCTMCLSTDLHRIQRSFDAAPDDYYEFLARTPQPAFRLNCEEMTGQTDADDRIERQRLFQEVFMETENELVMGVDLLSVTTTMAAGVDIGALQAIQMANMPPVRFNYQQRVGRAGRRGYGMSIALTLCRARTHDDYYFDLPHLIVSEPPPPPYVDVRRPEIAMRVVNKEILKRAFDDLDLPDAGGDSVHGEFGTVGNWRNAVGDRSAERPSVEGWIANPTNVQVIATLCTAIARRTHINSQDLINHVRNDLISKIDEIADSNATRPDRPLSELLAASGVLPMFGFPTRIRYLFHAQPGTGTAGWPPRRGIIDRELDIAISQFAPEAQSVKDDKIYTSVGVAEWAKQDGEVVALPDPLANPTRIGVCRRCQGLRESPTPDAPCPYCQAAIANDAYRVIDVNEPPSFCTWWSLDADFDGNFNFAAFALRSRMGAARNQPQSRLNFEIDVPNGNIYLVNDRDGQDFQFKKLANSHVWITEEAFNKALVDLPRDAQRRVTRPSFDPAVAPLTRALASIFKTDVLLAGIRQVPVGLCLNPAIPEARAAWYSFGFMLRRAAAAHLDVATSELEVGIQPVINLTVPFAPPTAQVFICDTLENGAGYSSYLATPDRFEALLRSLLNPGTPARPSVHDLLVATEHQTDCLTSCRCLREFLNMSYHPLLDWRLALDMARLALDSNTDISFEHDYWRTLVQQVVPVYFNDLHLEPRQFGTLPGAIDETQGEAIILTHPLWDKEIRGGNFCAPLAEAYVQAEQTGYVPRLHSIFRAVRFPYE
jgi:Lhr-like helicase